MARAGIEPATTILGRGLSGRFCVRAKCEFRLACSKGVSFPGPRCDAGEIDAFAVDDAIYQYKRAAQKP